MLLDFFEKINSQLGRKLPFVVYRKPNDTKVNAIFQSDDRLHLLKDYSETGFIFAPFESKNPTILLKPDEVIGLPDISLPHTIDQTELGPSHDAEQKKFHIDLVKKAIDHICTGTFKKVVLSRKLERVLKDTPMLLFERLLANYAHAFCYLWYHPKVGMWLGATPEILLTARNSQLTTMSLAGTQLFEGNENPKWGNKELEEQELVTDYITDALEKHVSNLKRTTMETVRADNLLHLRTKISGTIDENDLGTVVKALHPTPAVCGLPKKEAKNFILDHEGYDREFYTGFLGELNFKIERKRSLRGQNTENQAYRTIFKMTTLFVNLRCMQLKDAKAILYVGGGVTKDSDVEKEWQETVAKSKTMLKTLGRLSISGS